jgi:transposase
MNQEFKKLCLIEINKLNEHIDRKRYKVKYSDEYYLNFIFYMLNDINKWSFIVKLKDYNSKFKYHYKTIYNKFIYWSNNKVFYNAFYNFHFKQNTNLLLIDATSINNKYGSECIVINPEYRKKKITKLSVVSNKDNFIHSVEVFEIKNENKKYNTSIHDVKMINKSLDKVFVNNKSKYFNLLGDKAYKTKKEYKLNKKNIKIITPDKSNTINKNTKFKNKKLKKRIKVENAINNIKRYERVKTRKDRNITTYMSWVYIASLINNLNVNK